MYCKVNCIRPNSTCSFFRDYGASSGNLHFIIFMDSIKYNADFQNRIFRIKITVSDCGFYSLISMQDIANIKCS